MAASNPFENSSSSSTQGTSKEKKLSASEQQLWEELDDMVKEMDDFLNEFPSELPLPEIHPQQLLPSLQENKEHEKKNVTDLPFYIDIARIAREEDKVGGINEAIAFCSTIEDLDVQKEQVEILHPFIIELANAGQDISGYIPAYLGWINRAIEDPHGSDQAKTYFAFADELCEFMSAEKRDLYKEALQELDRRPSPETQRQAKRVNATSLTINSSKNKISALSDALSDCLEPNVLFTLAKIVFNSNVLSAYYLARLAKLLVKNENDRVKIDEFLRKLDNFIIINDCQSFSELGIRDGIKGAASAKELYERVEIIELFCNLVDDAAVKSTLAQMLEAKNNERDYGAIYYLLVMMESLLTDAKDKEKIAEFRRNYLPVDAADKECAVKMHGHTAKEIQTILNLSQIARDILEEEALRANNSDLLQVIKMTDAMRVHVHQARTLLGQKNYLPLAWDDFFTYAQILAFGGVVNGQSVVADRAAAYYCAKLAYIAIDNNSDLKAEMKAEWKQNILSFIVANKLSASSLSQEDSALYFNENTSESMYATAVVCNSRSARSNQELNAKIVMLSWLETAKQEGDEATVMSVYIQLIKESMYDENGNLKEELKDAYDCMQEVIFFWVDMQDKELQQHYAKQLQPLFIAAMKKEDSSAQDFCTVCIKAYKDLAATELYRHADSKTVADYIGYAFALLSHIENDFIRQGWMQMLIALSTQLQEKNVTQGEKKAEKKNLSLSSAQPSIFAASSPSASSRSNLPRQTSSVTPISQSNVFTTRSQPSERREKSAGSSSIFGNWFGK